MDMIPATIYSMTEGDIEEALALWQNMPGVGLRAGDDNPLSLKRYLERNSGCSFVARTTSAHTTSDRTTSARTKCGLVGTILAGHDGRRGFIYHTAVSESHRGHGVGRALAEHALEALRAQGIRKVALVAFAKNSPAQAFWRKMGFGHREDLTYMDCTLIGDLDSGTPPFLVSCPSQCDYSRDEINGDDER